MALLLNDPISFLLDSDGELDFKAGMAFSSGRAGVAQSIRVRVLLFKGEWFANLDTGLPWHQDILGQKFETTRVRDAFRTVIATAPGVESIEKLTVSFDGDTRTLTVGWTVLTTFGDTVEDLLTESV